VPLALVLREAQLLLATERGVLRADEAQALGDVAELLRWGQDEARRMRQQAEQDALGLAERARADAERRTREAVAQAVAEVHVQAATLLAELEPRVAQAVVQVLARMGAALDREALLAQALAEVRRVVDGRALAVLKVAPADLAQASQAVAQLIESADLPATFELRPDPALAPGHCVLQSAAGLYRFGLEQQLVALRKALGDATGRAGIADIVADPAAMAATMDATEHA
jgi:type III secretion protein L